MPKVWAERHDAELPSQVGDASWDYETHANGTGPFMLEEFESGERTVLVRNPHWWDSRNTHATLIGSSKPNCRCAQGAQLLLAGEIDLLWYPAGSPADQLEQIAATPALKVQKAESDQTLYLGFDQSSPELRSSNVKKRNPFADVRVRQAVYQGIDIDRIVDALHGLAVPAGMLIWPKGIGWSEELDRRLPYDPEKAKALLADAGYPEGFDVRFDCWAPREPACRTIGASLQEIGIGVDVALLPTFELGQKI